MIGLRATSLTLLAAVLLSGCIHFGKSLPTDEPYSHSKDEALVLIGTVGQKPTITIDTGKPFVVSEITLRDPKPGTDVFALRAKVGDDFHIYKVYAGGTYLFHTPSELHIDKPGIYYYGTLMMQIGVGLTRREIPEVLQLARTKYKGAFEVLQPVNFK